VGQAAIVMGAASGNTLDSGVLNLSVKAGDTMVYTVSKPGYVDTGGTANPALSPNPVTFDPTIRGTAFNSGSTSPSLTMNLCNFATGIAGCTAGTRVDTTTTAASLYSFAATPGHYWVKAVSPSSRSSAVEIYVLADGTLSLDGTNVIATMPSIDIIDPPTNLAATAAPSGVGATVTWTRNNAAGLTTEVKLDNGAWVSAGTTETTTFTALAPATTYTVWLRTKSTFGVSSPVSTTVTTGVVPPAALALTPSANAIAASWTAIADVTYQVRIYVTSAGPSGTFVAASGAGSHSFTGLNAATGYTVEARSTANGFQSTVSSATASTPA
jgi:hypothetical protein